MLAAFMIGAALLGALSVNVSAQAQLPVWEVGDGWYFGETVDFTDLQEEIDAGLSEIPPGFTADVNVAGGIGIYAGIEVVSDSVDVNGYTCYQVDIDGAIGIDFGLEASVDGSMNEDFMSIDIDASGNAVVEGEANLDGSLFFTVDDLAFVKGTFTFTADATATASIDADVKMNMAFGGQSESIDAHIVGDASVEVNNVVLTGSLEFDPPIDFFDFPIHLGDMWNVPTSDTDVTGTWSGIGTIVARADITGISDMDPMAEDVHESETIDLATEIGSHTVDAILDSTWDAVTLRCVAVIDDTYYIIETDTADIFAYTDFGTRQFGGINPLDMLPIDDVMPETAGVQYSANDGFINGVSVDGEVMTSTTDKATVDTFTSAPLEEVQEETGGHGDVGTGGSGILPLLFIGIILIVVILVIVAVVATRGKKKGPEQMYGAPQQQQPYQQQPPPEQPQQPPQDQPQQPPPEYPPEQPPEQPPPPPPDQ